MDERLSFLLTSSSYKQADLTWIASLQFLFIIFFFFVLLVLYNLTFADGVLERSRGWDTVCFEIKLASGVRYRHRGGRENQMIISSGERPDEGVCILGVLDGHGRDVGKLAAQTGKRFLSQYFEQNYGVISSDPLKYLAEALQQCHLEIKNAFRTELTKNGFEVSESPEGYLMKRRLASQHLGCVYMGEPAVL